MHCLGGNGDKCISLGMRITFNQSGDFSLIQGTWSSTTSMIKLRVLKQCFLLQPHKFKWKCLIYFAENYQ